MDCNQVLPLLYLGSYECLYKKTFNQISVDAIINTTPAIETPIIPIKFDNAHYRVPMTFTMSKNEIKNAIKTIAKIIDNLINDNKRIYIHCYEGISRSATCVIYYMYAYKGMTMLDALSFVKSKRKSVCPNELMLECLKELDEEMHNS
jgi:protein-tyrosine phosphatase